MSNKRNSRKGETLSIGELAKNKVAKPIMERQIDNAVKNALDDFDTDDIGFMHSVLCQTCLPYRNQKDLDIWERKQGDASLAIQTRKMKNPSTGEYEFVGLPFGPKARLILAYINTEAILKQDPRVFVHNSMTTFIKQIGIGTAGHQIRSVKEQLKRLAASDISISYANDEQYFEDGTRIIKRLNLWFPKNESQRIIWDSYIDLSTDYYESLLRHAIPWDMNAFGALSNNAMAMDTYTWLAQRLHRIKKSKTQFIPWTALNEQFGLGYLRIRDFRRAFREVLKTVLLQYHDARHSVNEVGTKGLILTNAKPPVPKKFHNISPILKE